MSTPLAQDVDRRLRADFAFRREGDWYRRGKCPGCGKKELWTHAVTPRVLRCGRLDRCGFETSVRDYYPDLFDDFSRRFAQTEAEPNAAADAYLSHARGLDLRGLRGAYAQEYYRDAARDIGSATVRFPLPGGGWWERLIDQPGRFDRKARFCPGKSYAGHWWSHPAATVAELAAADDLWLAEGIFDALALRQAGVVAVSLMTVTNWPAHALADLRRHLADTGAVRQPRLVFAFDVGRAGTEWTRKFVARAREEGWTATAAQVRPDGEGTKLDWNDLLLRDALGPKERADYLWNGEVTLAESAIEKACLFRERHKWSAFPLVHDRRTWWAAFNEERIAEVMLKERLTERAATRSCAAVTEIANCTFRVLYRERDPVIDETNYFLRIDFPGKMPTEKGRFAAGALAAAGDFKKRLLAFGGMFTGATGQLDRIVRAQTADLRTVIPVDFTGYAREHGAWLLGRIAVKDGRVHHLNDEDYFDLARVAVKMRSTEHLLSLDYDPDRFPLDWLPSLWTAFGPRGLVALAFWTLSFFAEQVRAEQKSLAFLELIGEPGSGKSTLLEFLWRLCGRDAHEGFDPTKASVAATARNLGKVANLPVVLIEGDRSADAAHSKKFEWDELKTAYNGRAVRSRGVRNAGMETFDPPFRGAIIVAQNYPVDASPALLERLMRLTFDKRGWSSDTKAAAERIERWPTEPLSGFLVHVIRREESWLEAYRAAYAEHELRLPERSGIRHQRLIKNHAQLAAALDALAEMVRLPADHVTAAHAIIAQMVRERHDTISADHPVVQAFWERIDWLMVNESDETLSINQSRDPAVYAINLNSFEAKVRSAGLNPIQSDEIRKYLRGSKIRRFLDCRTVNGRSGRSLHCWRFERPPHLAADRP